MILHLVNDEKIIDRTVRLFESIAPGKHLFVVFSGKKEFKHVTPSESVISKADFLKQKRSIHFSTIIIHLLNSRKIRFIKKIGLKDIPIYWIIWGVDLYNKLLEPKGFEICYDGSDVSISSKLSNCLKTPFVKIKSYIRVKRMMKFILGRVNYLVTDTTENDYEVFGKYYPEINKIPWKDFFYYPIDEILSPELMNSQVKDNNILIGNSGSLSNNHEYAYEYLSKLNVDGRKIIVPLSYSGSRSYKKRVIDKGQVLFENNFCPLIDFLPLDKYNELMVSAGVAVYANWRQEAIGNIIIALYLGAKVFIANRNPVFAWAQGHGLIVHELEKISQAELDTPLTMGERENNRTILAKLYNRERFLKLTEETFQLSTL